MLEILAQLPGRGQPDCLGCRLCKPQSILVFGKQLPVA